MRSEMGYINPMRSLERRLAPDYAQRELRDPGLRTPGGLGSLRHTMPHLHRMTVGPRLAAGGSNPVGSAYAAARGNTYNPDPMFRSVHSAIIADNPMTNPSLRQISMQPSYVYASGGEADDPNSADKADDTGKADAGPQELQSPDDEMSSGDDHLHQVVLEAMAALEGQSPDPEEALAHFIDIFGPQALSDLQQLVEEKHSRETSGDDEEDQSEPEPEPEPGEPDEEEDQDAQAGGGLLRGPGTGQSDEIHGTTPGGHPVLLSDGEYVIDAPTVAALGDGSTSAGARRLDDLRKQIRHSAYGHDKQAKPMKKSGGPITLKLR